MAKQAKTNAMRILETLGIRYDAISYEADEFTDAQETADKLGLPHEEVFKTLVTEGNDREHYVFVIPIDATLNLKKCAVSVGVKSVQMIHQKELFPLTGYVRGGCTAIGMKRQFATRLDETAMLYDKIYISAGRIGCQIHLSPEDFLTAAEASYADLTE